MHTKAKGGEDINIQVQCCGIVLLIVLLIFYMNQKKLNLATEKAFLLTFIVSFACIILDVLSIVTIMNMEQLHPLLVAFICKSYPASLVSVSSCCLRYVYMDVYRGGERFKAISRSYGVLWCVFMAIIYILPIKYHYKPEASELYTYGPGVIATYIIVMIYVATIIYIMIRQKDKINPNRMVAVRIWLVLWIGSALIQAVNNNLLLVGYAACLGIMILYLKLENPEANLERTTGLFNQNALKLYLEQLYSEKKRFSVVAIVFDRAMNQNISVEEDYEGLSKLINYLMGIPKSNVFKNSEGMVLILEDVETSKEEVEKIQNFFECERNSAQKNYGNPTMVYVRNGHQLSNGDDLLYLIRYTKENNMDFVENSLAVVSDSTIADMYQEKNVMKQLLSAMDANRVEVFYQPIYSIKEHKFTTAEALVRIRDEKGQIVSPGVFIPVAEKHGIIIRLGEMVFEKVCAFIRENRLAQYGIRYVEINLSVIQCADEHLAERFIRIMEKYNINPDMINLEITESASLSAKRILLDNMKNLMNYGIKFSLDDFGTGQSNLNYIVDMPVDIVKFDRDMINAYFENGKASYVMDAAIRMIHGMELQIVSEGIETEKQFKIMESLGISYIQGYYFSKPLPEKEFLKFLENCQ